MHALYGLSPAVRPRDLDNVAADASPYLKLRLLGRHGEPTRIGRNSRDSSGAELIRSQEAGPVVHVNAAAAPSCRHAYPACGRFLLPRETRRRSARQLRGAVTAQSLPCPMVLGDFTSQFDTDAAATFILSPAA